MTLKLSNKAEEVIRICGEKQIYPHDLVEQGHELSDFINNVITSSDDFWYGITNGYIAYQTLLAPEEIDRVEKAITLLEELEQIAMKCGIEY
jgi:hypothetical protein